MGYKRPAYIFQAVIYCTQPGVSLRLALQQKVLQEKVLHFYQQALLCAHTVGVHKPAIIQVGLEEE